MVDADDVRPAPLLTGLVDPPVKALLMNVLMLSAAFGLLVLIFQDGRLEGLGLESEARSKQPAGVRALDRHAVFC
jgi:uncharacterized membrane protein YdfJ with MMPL/SSD domain